VFQLLVLVVVGVSGLAITNMLMISVHERRRELAMLDAVGSSPKRIRSMVLFEAVALGLIGGIIGAAVGGFGRQGAVRAVEAVSGFPVDATFSAATLLVGVALVLAISALGALAPALQAGRRARIDRVG